MSSISSPSGLWKPSPLSALYYGSSSVSTHLLSTLPTPTSRAFILSTRSLSRTSLLSSLEILLGPEHHGGTSTSIGQHAPVADIDAAARPILSDASIDTIISVGGGSPIDAAKAISQRVHDADPKRGFLWHITIPTTLSAAECTFAAGFTGEGGKKELVAGKELAPSVIFYDVSFARETPERLWLSTGIRALDHAVEMLYNESAAEVPQKLVARSVVGELFTWLKRYKADPKDEEVITRCQLAAWASAGFVGLGMKRGGLGLSHSLGYALGSPYGIPHGITSCLTLGKTVQLKAMGKEEDAREIASVIEVVGGKATGDIRKDAVEVGKKIEELVRDLGLETKLVKDWNVGEDQVDVVATTATKGTGYETGEGLEKVKVLVKSLL